VRIHSSIDIGGDDAQVDEPLAAFLCTALRARVGYAYGAVGKSRRRIYEEEAKKRGHASPDRAESLVMAFCKIVPREQTY